MEPIVTQCTYCKDPAESWFHPPMCIKHGEIASLVARLQINQKPLTPGQCVGATFPQLEKAGGHANRSALLPGDIAERFHRNGAGKVTYEKIFHSREW